MSATKHETHELLEAAQWAARILVTLYIAGTEARTLRGTLPDFAQLKAAIAKGSPMHICIDHLHRYITGPGPGEPRPGDQYAIVEPGPECSVCELEHEEAASKAA